MRVTLRVHSVRSSNSETTLSPNARNRQIPPHTHMQSWTGTHASTQGGCRDHDETAQTEDKERPALHMYELETNEKCERVVKEATLDLAVNFLVQLCTHWIDVAVRVLVAERYATSTKQVAACATMHMSEKQFVRTK